MYNDDDTKIMELPARVNYKQAAQLLGFEDHDIPVLVKCKLLKPLGDPAQQCTKYFAKSKLLKHSQNENWLSRASNAIYEHWAKQNAQKRKTIDRGEIKLAA